jgi:hypothetical protein
MQRKKIPTNRFGHRIGTVAAKISEALDETPRTPLEIARRAGRPGGGARGFLDSMVTKGQAKKGLIDGRVRYWLR